MIALLDTSEDIKVCEKELGCRVEQLLTPLTRFQIQFRQRPFAIDNGAYARFDKESFTTLLEREYQYRELCRFVAVPDVPYSALRTREVFDYWYPLLTQWNLAYVAQDGQEHREIPWYLVQAVFIGGSTEFKMGRGAIGVIKAAQAMGKWVHVGRVNYPGRFEYFEKLGVDSIDGTGLAKRSDLRQAIKATVPE